MAPLAVSLGDPAGIGPELIAAAWALRRDAALPPFFAVGGARLLAEAAVFRTLEVPVARIERAEEASACFAEALPVLGPLDCAYSPGIPEPAGAEVAFASLKEATRLALHGQAGGLVTAPIAKAELAKVGFTWPGQTEFLAAQAGLSADDAVMMLAGPQLRAVPLTVHLALADVPGQITAELIIAKARIVARGLQRDLGIAEPRLAVAALNPHAGEQGRFGSEDRDVIAPAIAQLRAEGLAVTGPHPADALFAPHARSGYDAALCMYHDQALIPVKALDFDQGVNVTLGLPIVRTSPDHGTAFDIAGRGLADPGALIAAIRMAGDMAAARARI